MRNESWVVLADARRCRLLCCGLTRHDRCHVEEYESFHNTWPGHEHHRPSPLSGKTGDSYAAQNNEASEDLNRFARQVANWLDHKIDNGIGSAVLFAPPRFLGALRSVQPDRFSQRVRQQNAEMVHLPIRALSKHPAIRRLVGSAETGIN
jgi:protein required for attachment to host cells